MRLRSEIQREASIDELLEHEAVEHDEDYAGKYAFGSPTLKFSRDYAWQVNDHVYKKGTYIRGFLKRRLFEVLDLNNLAGKKVLDAGCGNGQHAVFLAMYGARVSGFDLSPVGVKMAEAMAEANGVSDLCEFGIANISELPYDDEEFDLIVHNAVLHHMLKYPNVREETFRVLKPGGRVIIVEGIRENPIYRGARTIKDFITRNELDLGDVDLEMKDILEFTQGFTEVHFERRCLVEGIKEGIGRYYSNGRLTRGILYVAKRTDDVLLKLFPGLEKYCTEIVAWMRKPSVADCNKAVGNNSSDL